MKGTVPVLFAGANLKPAGLCYVNFKSVDDPDQRPLLRDCTLEAPIEQ